MGAHAPDARWGNTALPPGSGGSRSSRSTPQDGPSAGRCPAGAERKRWSAGLTTRIERFVLDASGALADAVRQRRSRRIGRYRLTGRACSSTYTGAPSHDEPFAALLAAPKLGRGAVRTRTGVNGFAGRCVATPPRRRGRSGKGTEAPGLRSSGVAALLGQTCRLAGQQTQTGLAHERHLAAALAHAGEVDLRRHDRLLVVRQRADDLAPRVDDV